MNLFKTIFLFAIFCIPYFTINGQDWDYSYTHFGKEDGLPSNTIYCIVADLDGILWIGTDAGLVRFDGSHIKTYTIKDGLPSNDIFDLFCDSKNRVWITSMSKEAAYIDKGVIATKSNNKALEKIIIPSKITNILEDNKKNIWIIAFPFTLNVLDKNLQNKPIDLLKSYGYCFKSIKFDNSIIFITESQTVIYSMLDYKFESNKFSDPPIVKDLISINDKIYYLDSGKNKILTLNFKKFNYRATRTNTKFLFHGQDEHIWNITNDGILSDNLKGSISRKPFFINNKVSWLKHDKLNNNWLGTLGNGLFKVDNKNISFFSHSANSSLKKIKSLNINSNFILVGNDQGDIFSLNRRDKENVQLLRISQEKKEIQKIKNTIENNLIIQQNNKLIYSSSRNGRTYTFNYPSVFKNFYVLGDTLIALTHISLCKFNIRNSNFQDYQFDKRLYSYAPYQNNTMIGAEDGLYTFNQNVLKPYPLNDTLNSRIMDMQVKDSILLLATVDKGIYFIHNHQIIQHLQVSDGLSSNNCSKMKVYKNKLYVATNKGMSIYNFTTQKINTLYESDGLASTMVNDFDIDQDTIYAATDNGLSMIAIQNIRTDKSYPLFNKPTYVGNDTIWDRKNYFVTQTGKPFQVMLNALTYQTKGNVLFYYRYKNGDKLFKETSDQLIPLYFETPGNYDFEAYAVDANNYKSNLLSIRIFVKPYYWQTLWFKTIVIIGFIGCLVLLFYFLLKRVKRNEEIKRQRESRMHHLELSAWRAKINPHFLFNSLNTLQYLFTANKIEKANEYMSSFSKILRTTIDNSGKLLNTVAGEHDYLEKYLRLESFKRKNTFSYKITINDVGIHQYYIPSLILQPVVENSLKHGLKGNDKGEILVHFQLNEFDILCSIQDNGKGFEDYNHLNPEHKSHGIQLIHDKLRILESVLNQHFIFTFETLYDKHGIIIGSKTSFIFPLITKNVE